MAIRALKCVRSYAVGRAVVRAGELKRSDDPVVKGHEAFFVDVLENLGVEQATANPGEGRTVKKAPRKSAEKRSKKDDS